ncbi:hypothetical protein [Clostridium merdae]|uniref:hypothetical protein n=1 Tax=Clostridium merdae TaxID=1958780 RepID=UPI000A26C897|nr:hypothetical protein [Clostridium merdae]
MKKRVAITALSTLILVVFCGCSVITAFSTATSSHQESSSYEEPAKQEEDSYQLAKVEVYSAKDDRLIKTIDDSELLSKLSEENEVADDADKLMQSTPENGVPLYNFVAYKVPVAKITNQKAEKIFTITIFENSNLIRTEVASEAIKSFPIPSQYLTFYEEVSKEKINFFLSLAKEP